MMPRWTPMRIAAVVAGTVAPLVLNTLPGLTGVLARSLGYGAGALGAFASADVVGITVGTLLSMPIMRRGSAKRAVVLGLGALIAANGASAATGTAAALIVLRAIGGVGTGLTLGACFLVYAREDRERNFAAYTLGQTGLATVVMAWIPKLAHAFGWRAPFLCLAALAFPALLLASRFPAEAVAAAPPRPSGPASAASRMLYWLGILSVTLFFLGQGSLWTYLERIGAASGLAETVIDTSLTICAAFGFISAILVLRLGERVTRPAAILMSVAINVAAALTVDSHIPQLFAASISVFYFSLPIFVAGQFGAITRLPEGSRFAVLVSTATFGGFAIGPLVGAALAARFGYAAVQWLDIVLVSAAGLLLLPLLRRNKVAWTTGS